MSRRVRSLGSALFLTIIMIFIFIQALLNTASFSLAPRARKVGHRARDEEHVATARPRWLQMVDRRVCALLPAHSHVLTPVCLRVPPLATLFTLPSAEEFGRVSPGPLVFLPYTVMTVLLLLS